MPFPRKNAAYGFTLVELAIVLMIIGLLIGGVLRGQELMNNARISGTIQQVKAYQGAMVTFRDAYAALPGDMPTALNRIPGCMTDNKCGNGNGNGIIGNPGVGNSAGTTAMPRVETSYFWKHLALAHLISGVDPSADPVSANWGKTHPAAKIGGGFVIFYSDSATPGVAGDYGIGHNLELLLSPTQVPTVSAADRGNLAISPKSAYQLDKKMDDGLSDSGEVSADYVVSGCETGAQGNQYATSEEKNCILYFGMD